MFIHSPVDRYLSSFQFKTYTTKAAVNICFHFSWVNKYLGVESPVYMIGVCLT